MMANEMKLCTEPYYYDDPNTVDRIPQWGLGLAHMYPFRPFPFIHNSTAPTAPWDSDSDETSDSEDEDCDGEYNIYLT